MTPSGCDWCSDPDLQPDLLNWTISAVFLLSLWLASSVYLMVFQTSVWTPCGEPEQWAEACCSRPSPFLHYVYTSRWCFRPFFVFSSASHRLVLFSWVHRSRACCLVYFVKSDFSVPEPDWCFEASGFSLWFLTWWTAGKHGIFLQESLPHLTECCPWQTAQHSRWNARFFSPMMTSFTQLLSSLKPVTISDERNANLTLDSKLVLRVMRKQADLDSQVLIGW